MPVPLRRAGSAPEHRGRDGGQRCRGGSRHAGVCRQRGGEHDRGAAPALRGDRVEPDGGHRHAIASRARQGARQGARRRGPADRAGGGDDRERPRGPRGVRARGGRDRADDHGGRVPHARRGRAIGPAHGRVRGRDPHSARTGSAATRTHPRARTSSRRRRGSWPAYSTTSVHSAAGATLAAPAGGDRACAVRDDPPVRRRQRPRGPGAHRGADLPGRPRAGRHPADQPCAVRQPRRRTSTP